MVNLSLCGWRALSRTTSRNCLEKELGRSDHYVDITKLQECDCYEDKLSVDRTATADADVASAKRDGPSSPIPHHEDYSHTLYIVCSSLRTSQRYF